MNSNLKLISLIVLAIGGLTPNVFSQSKNAEPGAIKTVVLYSSKKSFFTEYPIDSVVSNLNSLNTNKKVKYYKSTEDNSKTGLTADYRVDLNIVIRKGTYIGPTYTTYTSRTPDFRDSTRASDRILTTTQTTVQSSPGRYHPDQYELKVILTAAESQKKRRKSFTGLYNNDELYNAITLIIDLEKYLLEYFK